MTKSNNILKKKTHVLISAEFGPFPTYLAATDVDMYFE